MKKNKIEKKRSVKKNAILSVIKQLFSIIFPMITFPYATRILGVENYGKYTFSVSIVNYISYIAAAGILRYAVRECARVRDDKKKLHRLVNEIYTINISTTIVAYLILFALLAFVPMLREYVLWIMLISLSVLFTTIGTDWINSAFEDYFFITIRYILSQMVALSLLFLLVRNQDDITQYVIVSIFGGILANILNVLHIRRTLKIVPRLIYSKQLLNHIKPILYLFASTIATVIYINSDVTLLRIYADDASVGYYGVSTQFYQLVKQLINAAFIVIIPRISNELAKDKSLAYSRYNKILTVTILVMIPCATGLFMIRNNLILLFSGEEYLKATSSLAILAVSLIPAMTANFFINIVMIPLGMEKKVMIATITSGIVNIGLNFVLIPIFAENAAAFTTLIAEISMILIAMFYCRSMKFRSVIKAIVTGIVGAGIIVLVCFLLNSIISNYFANIVLCITISSMFYGVVILIFYREKVMSIIRDMLISR